jgi:hypothetical protein
LHTPVIFPASSPSTPFPSSSPGRYSTIRRFNSGLALVPRPSLCLSPHPNKPALPSLTADHTHPRPPRTCLTRFPRPNDPPTCRLSPQSAVCSATRPSTHLLQRNHVRPQLYLLPGLQFDCSRECCSRSLVREVPSANRDACTYAPKSGDHHRRKIPSQLILDDNHDHRPALT